MNIIDKYLKLIRNEVLPNERSEIYRELNEHKETTEIKKIQRALFLNSIKRHGADEELAVQSLNKFHNQRNIKQRRLFFNKYLPYAALFILAFTLGGIFTFNSNSQDTNLKFTEIFAPQGQRLRLVLEDSSVVWLNSNSKLYYASDFGKNERRVKLLGEAYFEVQKNKSVPFIVQTPHEEIKVLGTEFNVSAYNGRESVTTLITGKVELTSSLGKIVMSPNEIAYQSNGKWIKEPLLKNDKLLWKEGIYVFENSSIEDMATELSKYYDVQIHLKNPASANIRFSGKFRQRDGIDEVFKLLQRAIHLQYSYDREKNTIEVY